LNPVSQLSAALAGRYEIEREIGAGGMATVYLARDVRHSRRVALKVLRPELGAVLGVDRFLSEIQVTANLQHPNLLPLFDSGEANGLLFYVMPFVEGESLRARLDREKQLPVDEAVRIAVAIAGALDYAHNQGVIHRDLKPENILLQSGQPVIADFGIALAVSNAGGTRVTQTGLSLGTPQYMSPEQATGDRGIDGRTDIYSLAAITYEMLAGEPPHSGTSAQAIIAKLMTEEVRPVTTLRRSVPAHVEAAVRHGLEKLAADRFATAGEFSLALTGARPFVDQRTSQATATASLGTSAPLDRRTKVVIGALALAAAAGIGTAAWLGTRSEPAPVMARFPLDLPDSVRLLAGGGTKLAITRDGRAILMVGRRNGIKNLYLRRIDDPVAQLVRGTEAGTGSFNVSPRFSFDGQWIAFVTEDRLLKKVPVLGGTPLTLADSVAGSFDWGDGDRLVYTRNGELWLATGEGRNGRRLLSADTARGHYRYSWPHVLPGGNRALITIDRSPVSLIVDSLRLGVVSLTDGAVTELELSGTNPYYVATGHIVFGRPGGLVFAAPFSLRKGEVTGPPRLLIEGVWQGTGGATGFAVSDNGTLVYHGGTGLSGQVNRLVVVDRSGRERAIPGEPFDAGPPRISPDGKRIAVAVMNGGAPRDVSLIDAITGARQRLVESPWSPNVAWDRTGQRVLYVAGTQSLREVVSRAWDRSSGDMVLLRDSTRNLTSVSPGPAHTFFAFTTGIRANRDIHIAPSDSVGSLRPLIASAAHEITPDISPSGRWLAYASNESENEEIYVQPLPGPGPRIQVSVSGGSEPVWGSEQTLYYRAGGRIHMATLGGSPFQVTQRDSLFEDEYQTSRANRIWDVFPGGREFLLLKSPSAREASEVFVVLNWQQMLDARQTESRER
jgi:serine/threonine protein kinase/Tol biopolymer transport system component